MEAELTDNTTEEQRNELWSMLQEVGAALEPFKTATPWPAWVAALDNAIDNATDEVEAMLSPEEEADAES